MKFADCVKETFTATTAAVIALLGAVVDGKFRRFIAAFQVGETEICARVEDSQGNWEVGLFTLTNANTLTRTKILSSSNNGAAVTFASGVKEVFTTVSAEALAEFLLLSDGITVAALTTGTPTDTDLMTFHRPGVGDYKISFASLKAAIGGTAPPADTTAPTVSSAQVANATPNRIDITFSESLANSVPAVGAFAVSGGKTVQSVTVAGAVVSITVSPAYANGDTITVGYTQPGANPRLQDGAGNLAATFSGRAVTNNIGAVATKPAAPTIGTAVAGDGFVDVYFTRNSNGGSAVLDSTATLSTGQTVTGTSSPIRVSAPNGTAVTATVRDRNAQGPSDPSAESNSVTPQAAAPVKQYTVRTTQPNGTAISGVNFPSTPGTWQGSSSDRYVAPSPGPRVQVLDTEGKAPDAVKFVWGTSPTVPPAGVTFASTTLPAGATENVADRSTGIANSSHYGNWTEASPGQYYGVLGVSGSLYGWGPAITRPLYLYVLTPDGGAFVLDNGAGPVAWQVNAA